MNKSELIDHVASKTELSRKDAGAAVDAILEGVIGTLKSGEEVRLTGFGTFGVSERAARDGRNPRTGETIKIKASKSPKFSAGKQFKDALN